LTATARVVRMTCDTGMAKRVCKAWVR